LGMAMMFIHHAEFSQLAADDHMQEQALQMRTDVMTGALNRFAYTRVLQGIRGAGRVPKKLAVFSIDVNGLKTVNDTMGHEAGDELIQGAAACIFSSVGNLGRCFRTGGDEFVVIAAMTPEEISATKERLARSTSVWRGKLVPSLHLAVGSASAADYPDLDTEKLVAIADQEMYRDKSAYYRAAGIDRRRSNRQTDS
ncbi:MAG: GGDEF domain-containing protein, partial [Oscillibacter sp.]|nr:GGDEF domain-containing protein [Oscillibacter sp.]